MGRDGKRKIIISYADEHIIQNFLAGNSNPGAFSWLYLGKNVPLCLSLEKKMPGQSSRIDIGNDLQDSALRLRQDFIDYIGQLSCNGTGVSWWWTSLSEKNPFISNAFLHFCYLDVAVRVAQKEPGNLLILCESRGVMAGIRDALSHDPAIDLVLLDSPINLYWKKSRMLVISLVKMAYFIVRWSVRSILARIFGLICSRYRKSWPRENVSLIHSLIDNRTFRNEGKFDDIFLGNLGTLLKEKNQNVMYLCTVLPTLFYPVALTSLYKTREKCFLLEEFISPLDPLFALVTTHNGYPRIPFAPLFHNRNVDPIIQEEIHEDLLNTRSAQTFLYYRAGERLARKVWISVFIYHFENLMWEKMFCRSIRNTRPDCRLIGHQHSPVSPMDMMYTLSKSELPAIPLPDLIVANGVRAQKTLVDAGFDPDHIIIGGAFRYSALKTSRKPLPKVIPYPVLVVTTDDVSLSLELVTKCIHAFGEKKQFHVTIKFHPTLPLRKIMPFIPHLPGNFEIRNQPIDILLSTTHLILYTATTVSVEALAQKIPLIHIRSDMVIDRDIYDESDSIPSAATPKEIYDTACYLLEKTDPAPAASSRIAEEFFTPVTEECLTLFFPHTS
ncbi:hypothetical protein [Methanoregula sp.]|uniref:hypothetical protein n=1 Tax=Methanoregula sp. TaxID=2052170 RepID=UPI0035643645